MNGIDVIFTAMDREEGGSHELRLAFNDRDGLFSAAFDGEEVGTDPNRLDAIVRGNRLRFYRDSFTVGSFRASEYLDLMETCYNHYSEWKLDWEGLVFLYLDTLWRLSESEGVGVLVSGVESIIDEAVNFRIEGGFGIFIDELAGVERDDPPF